MKKRRWDAAISEVVGTIMLLIIAISLLTVVWIFALNQSVSTSHNTPPSATILGMTTEEKEIILEHRGGENLGLDTTIIFTIAGEQTMKTVKDLLDDESKADGQWNIGEKLVYDEKDITGLQVEATVIDDQSQAVVMSGIIQEGSS